MPNQHKTTLASLRIETRSMIEEVSLVIPTLGRAILEESLYWIVAGSAWPGALIVVDQGSDPQTADWVAAVRSLGIRTEHLHSPRHGRAAGINRGLERVATRFVAITDDDCFVAADWLEKMAARLCASPDAIVTGRVEATGDEPLAVTVSSEKPATYLRPRLRYDTISGGNMGTSMGVIARVGFFDEDARLRTSEDGEWAYRALRSGVPIVYAPEIVVRHYGWRDESLRLVQYKDYALSHGGFYGKYLRKGDWFIAIRALLHHLRAGRRWLRGIITRNPEDVLYGRAYFTGLLPGILAGMRKGTSG